MQENNHFNYIPTTPQPLGIWVLKNSIPDLDIDYWVDQCYIIAKTTPSVQKSNKNGYQSPSNLARHPNFLPLVNLLRKQIFLLNQHQNFIISDLWVNISKYGHYNMPHTHGVNMHQYSGVLYLTTPPDCGRIGFMNLYSVNGDITHLSPIAGGLLIFPSPLMHLVEPNHNHKDRISIAFNFS
jgi:hypothetical protein